jgi:hypothetical protein
MKERYHREITQKALGAHFSPAALEDVIRANLGQDALRYQFGHPHFHYDENSFAAADQYLEELRRATLEALSSGQQAVPARQHFGRLTHAAQDFYAHSNYTTLWREQNPHAAPEQIAPQLESLTRDPRLHSGRLYYPLELLSFIPSLKPLVLPLLPRDSHAWMNKDHPGQPDFHYAFHAAHKRTEMEFHQIIAKMDTRQIELFTGLLQPA